MKTPLPKRSITRIRNNSLRISAEEVLGSELYRSITVDKVIPDVRMTFIIYVVYIDDFGHVATHPYKFPTHLLTEDAWPNWLANTYCAQTSGCEYVIGSLSSRRNILWHANRFEATISHNDHQHQ